jgi:hypothetical protein
VSPRARRNLLEGGFDWATPVGRGGHRSVGRAMCVCLSKRCVLFFAGFKQDSPGFFRGPLGLSPTAWSSEIHSPNLPARAGLIALDRRHVENLDSLLQEGPHREQ